MKKISFVDDNILLGDCYLKRDYSQLSELIRGGNITTSCHIMEEDEIFGFHITKNENISSIYEMDSYVVKFVFSSVSQLHDDRQEQILFELVSKIKNYIDSCNGYYNLRIPTHIIDLVKAVNATFKDMIFCGGTVEEIVHGKHVDDCNENNLTIEFADSSYIENHRDELLMMTLESFRTYQGQYHISKVTQAKAGIIYENWINQAMASLNDERVVVAKNNGCLAGFVTIRETDTAVEGVLSAVSIVNRKLGAYKAMIAYLINHANRNNKSFVTSTQFDNFVVQGVWNSMGLKPFYSVYNIHIDNR